MKTKIIVTYGPVLEDPVLLRGVIKYADIVRVNFSHIKEDTAPAVLERIANASKETDKEIALLADLPGPKIRLGKLDNDIQLKKGEEVVLRYPRSRRAMGEAVPLDYDIYSYLRKGSILSIGDGYMKLEVISLSRGSEIKCAALNTGPLMSKKGISIANGNVTAAPPTEEDKKLAKFAVKNDFDFVAISFVRGPENVRETRKLVNGMPIVSKIEREVAVKGIRGIIEESDAIMVARGDLALDVPIETIPVIQNTIVGACREMNKPVIIATQTLASMVNSTMPTRAEVNDIAHSVMSGADCLMLSEETAAGKYPVEAVKMLATTAKNAEAITGNGHTFKIVDIGDSIAFAAAGIADNYKTECIFAPTQTGKTARKLSALRPRSKIIALSVSPQVRRRLKIYHGVESEPIGYYKTAGEMFRAVKSIAEAKGIKKYIVVSGHPNIKGSTNTLEYMDLGE